ncbi:hypothetical protein H5398_08470 [Tessaracoccus sp. MC1679]|uniref:hypothetical protein n=1 Tax=Tessaracoccus sp. MC1679 TaxID=2760313 RepID=UPI001602C0A0|nr:hypothetical protein [Tessaracoccus sp. MC1679]MBB1515999.1 hypothetical protein [Tessaracoccus sp. MC1679]
MVLPLIPVVLIAAGAISGGTGAVAGGLGLLKAKRARAQIADAQARSELDHHRTQVRAEEINEQLKNYGADQQRALECVLLRMAEFIRRNRRQVAESERTLVDGLDIAIGNLAGVPGLAREAGSIIAALVGAGGTGMGAAQGTAAAVTAFATAGTGTPIAALSGAAAQSATLAVLGGGTLASGGGGMALGALTLNFVMVGPAVLVGGMAINAGGERQLTHAARFAAKTEQHCAELAATREVFGGIEQRIAELRELLAELAERGEAALERLEFTEQKEGGFDPAVDASEFQGAMALAVAVRDMVVTPVLNPEGQLNGEAVRLHVKYRKLVEDGGK